jgi:hypothetical protein
MVVFGAYFSNRTNMNVDVCKKADFLYEESDFKKILCGLRRLLDDLNI